MTVVKYNGMMEAMEDTNEKITKQIKIILKRTKQILEMKYKSGEKILLQLQHEYKSSERKFSFGG